MNKDETLRLALDTLKEVREETFRLLKNGERLYSEDKVWSTIISIQEALETKDEPVAWQVMVEDEAMKEFAIKDMAHDWCVQQKLAGSRYAYWIRPLYTTPPQRTWVGLKDDDEIPWDGVDAKSFAKAIEAKLKEKNT